MPFELLPNFYLVTDNRFEEVTPLMKKDSDVDCVLVNLSKTFSLDNNRDAKNKNQFFLTHVYNPRDSATSKQTIALVADAFFKCKTILTVHDRTDLESVEVFIADLMKRYAGGHSYKSTLLDTIRLNLKSYQTNT